MSFKKTHFTTSVIIDICPFTAVDNSPNSEHFKKSSPLVDNFPYFPIALTIFSILVSQLIRSSTSGSNECGNWTEFRIFSQIILFTDKISAFVPVAITLSKQKRLVIKNVWVYNSYDQSNERKEFYSLR